VLNHEVACEVDFIAALMSSALEIGDSSVPFCGVLPPRKKALRGLKKEVLTGRWRNIRNG